MCLPAFGHLRRHLLSHSLNPHIFDLTLIDAVFDAQESVGHQPKEGGRWRNSRWIRLPAKEVPLTCKQKWNQISGQNSQQVGRWTFISKISISATLLFFKVFCVTHLGVWMAEWATKCVYKVCLTFIHSVFWLSGYSCTTSETAFLNWRPGSM